MKFRPILLFMFLALTQQACITHHVMDSYPKYLSNNEGAVVFPDTSLTASYDMTRATQDHKKKVQAISTGMAHIWMIEFGKVVDASMQGADFKKSFQEVVKGKADKDIHILFDVRNFDFTSHRSEVNLDVTVVNAEGVELFKKNYSEIGNSQGGKMFWAGPFGMRNAIHQSTKTAMDAVLKKLVQDIKNSTSQPNT